MDDERRRDLEGAGRVLAELATESKAGVDALLLVIDTLVEQRIEMSDKVYRTDNVPESGWKTYRKKVLTRAVKIDGPFTVETSEGPLRCKDGYLAVDARGYPYPIATDEFHLIYEEEPEEGVR